MNYTIQLHTESGSFAAPQENEVEHCKSKREIQRTLECWKEEVERFSEGRVFALVWYGHINSTQDIYPDAEASLGPRGGLLFCGV